MKGENEEVRNEGKTSSSIPPLTESFVKGENEEVRNEGKTSSSIPPLTESFVKGTNTIPSEEQCETATSDIAQESSTKNELIDKDSSNSVVHETDSPKDSTHEEGIVTEHTNHENDSQKNPNIHEPGDNGDETTGQEKKNITPHVKQDFSAINVELEYTGEDVQPLEENSGNGEDFISVESDSEGESEGGEDESENGKERDSEGDSKEEGLEDIRAAYGKSESEWVYTYLHAMKTYVRRKHSINKGEILKPIYGWIMKWKWVQVR